MEAKPTNTTDPLEFQWKRLPRRTRERICKAHGFGDYRVYAGYNWNWFQPHTREALKPRVEIETDAAFGFDRK